MDILDLFVKGKISDHISMEQLRLSMLIIKLKSYHAHRISDNETLRTKYVTNRSSRMCLLLEMSNN